MAKAKKDETTLTIPEPNFQTAAFDIYGTAPFVQNKFSGTKKRMMLESQTATKGTSKKAKAPRDLNADYEGAFHRTADGKQGIPAPAFRSAMISACRVAGFQMTKAKLSVFVEADAFDAEDGTPLVFFEGKPEPHESPVRLESGVASIAIRPMWREWTATIRVTWDGDQFGMKDVANLLARAGMQVGIGEGRHDSKKSYGMGWGTFAIGKPPQKRR